MGSGGLFDWLACLGMSGTGWIGVGVGLVGMFGIEQGWSGLSGRLCVRLFYPKYIYLGHRNESTLIAHGYVRSMHFEIY